MRRITEDPELQRLIAQGHGFLVKLTPGKQATVHPIDEYLCYNAREQMRASSKSYKTYFAETRGEITRPYPWGQEEVKPCPLCEQERQRRR
jgi:hypothetical protein